MVIIWVLWLAIVGLILVGGFLSVRSATRMRLESVRRRKLLRSREGIVNFGVSRSEAEEYAASPTQPLVGGGQAEHAARCACLRARWASDTLNCVSEESFLDSILSAKLLDRADKQVGPLHGVPVTVCDALLTAGLEAAVGTFEHLNDGPGERDCAAVAALRAAGAVVVCKSAVSTAAVFRHDTVSALLGPTTNPRDPTKVLGGPDGGGAALCAVGVGKLHLSIDSLRSATAAGVPGFTFSTERASTQGRRPIPGPHGPLTLIARDVESLATGASVLLEPVLIAPNDPLAVPMPFDRDAYESNEKLVIGVLTLKDGPPPEDCKALRRVEQVLTAVGHKVVSFEPEISAEELIVLRTALLTSERLQGVRRASDPQGLDPSLRTVRFWLSLPSIVRDALLLPMERTSSTRSLAAVLRGIQIGAEFLNYLRITKRRTDLRTHLVQRMVSQGVDALLVSKSPPGDRRKSRQSVIDAFGGDQLELSVLDLPVGVAPVPSGARDSEHGDVEDPAPNIWSDMPDSVEVVVPPWQDELCLCILRQIAGASAVLPLAKSFRTWGGPQPGGAPPKESTPLLAT